MRRVLSYGNGMYEERNVFQFQNLSSSSDSDDLELAAENPNGNWGRKSVKGAKFVRRGKLAAWSPTKGEWEVRIPAISYSLVYKEHQPTL